MKNFAITTCFAALALSLTPVAAMAEEAPKAAATKPIKLAPPTPLSKLVKQVNIPYQQFTLDNGLTVIVHEDRKAPVVAISVWYNVGSKHEPKGKTGFAHLFEHLMFNGSENAPNDFFEPLKEMGATNYNGTTWLDRTNYYETVPTGALDRGLMLESDRMGHLLGAVTQEKLTNQIGVVQNEKRQGDNAPYGMLEYEQLENLYPSGHPYHHSTIGSMADLSAASLEDVKQWFRDNYGPNNAILVLAGDIDLNTAKEKVNKWFGDIPRGKTTPKMSVPIPDLPADVSKTIKDQISTTRVYRMWTAPGLDNPDYLSLTAAGTVLGGLSSSRLDNSLVRGQEVAVEVSADAEVFAQGSMFTIYADAAPGVSKEKLEAALDAEIAKFLAEGPSKDELERAITVYSTQVIKGLESTTDKASILAESLLYQGSADAFRQNLLAAAKLTPKTVRDVTKKWLSRPVLKLTFEPGERTEGGENRGSFRWDDSKMGGEKAGLSPAYFSSPLSPYTPKAKEAVDRSQLPPLGKLSALDFPAIERATLSNGIKVLFAKRSAIPALQLTLSFDVGSAADTAADYGLHDMMLSAMTEGTTSFDAQQLAILNERYGISLAANSSQDNTTFSLGTLTANLKPALSILADYVRNPAFRTADVERIKKQTITGIKDNLNNPDSIAPTTMAPILYGDAHPYGLHASGAKRVEILNRLTPADLHAFHNKWFRPDLATIYVTGDSSLKEITALLEAEFGKWQAPSTPAPRKNFDAALPTQKESRIVLVNRPNSPQSVIMGAWLLGKKGTEDFFLLNSANEVFGGSFLSRINMNLREDKGWSYGVFAFADRPKDRASMNIFAPVQADRTGDSLVELRKELADFTGTKGVTPEELALVINGNVREIPGQFESARDVLGGIIAIDEFKRPDDYYETLAARYEGLTAEALNQEAAREMKDKNIIYVVVGDASTVKPQLEKLGLPIEVRELDPYAKQ